MGKILTNFFQLTNLRLGRNLQREREIVPAQQHHVEVPASSSHYWRLCIFAICILREVLNEILNEKMSPSHQHFLKK